MVKKPQLSDKQPFRLEDKPISQLRMGNFVFHYGGIWIVIRANKTWLHKHPYIDLLTYGWITGENRKRIFEHRQPTIKQISWYHNIKE